MTFCAAPPVLPAPDRKNRLPEPPTGVPCAAAGPTAVARMPAVRPAVRKLTARVRLLMEWIPHRSRPVLGDWQKVSSAGMTDKGIASSSCVRVDADRGRLLRKRSAFGRAARYDLPKTGDRLV